VAVALYAGSFDPIHLGHLGVIEQAARSYDGVVVAVVANPQKPVGFFRPEERLRLVQEATAHLESVRAVRFHGLTVDLARSEGATVLVRSAHKERASELSMAAMNQVLTGIPTAFVPAGAATRTISSSLVRQLIASGDLAAARELVPPCVAEALAGSTSP
jgi:pantetheine-phosphate adenylyltransferase